MDDVILTTLICLAMVAIGIGACMILDKPKDPDDSE